MQLFKKKINIPKMLGKKCLQIQVKYVEGEFHVILSFKYMHSNQEYERRGKTEK